MLRDVRRVQAGLGPILLGYAASPPGLEGSSCSLGVRHLPTGAVPLDEWLVRSEGRLSRAIRRASASALPVAASIASDSSVQWQAFALIAREASWRTQIAASLVETVLEARGLGRWICDWKPSQWQVMPRSTGDGRRTDGLRVFLSDVDGLQPTSSDCSLPQSCATPRDCIGRAVPWLPHQPEAWPDCPVRHGSDGAESATCSPREVVAVVERANLLDVLLRVLLGPMTCRGAHTRSTGSYVEVKDLVGAAGGARADASGSGGAVHAPRGSMLGALVGAGG